MANCPFARVGKRHNSFAFGCRIATETGFKVFRLSEQTPQGRSRIDPSLRYGIVRQDTRSAAEFVVSRLRPGDIVLANLTQAFYLYGRRMPDYALNTLLAARMIYLDEYQSYRHKFVGIPNVRNLRDIQKSFRPAPAESGISAAGR